MSSRWLASGGNDWKIKIFDIEKPSTVNNKSVVTLGEHRGAVTKIAVYPNGNLLASSGRDGHVKLWDTRSTVPLHELPPHSHPLQSHGLSAGPAGSSRLVQA